MKFSDSAFRLGVRKLAWRHKKRKICIGLTLLLTHLPRLLSSPHPPLIPTHLLLTFYSPFPSLRRFCAAEHNTEINNEGKTVKGNLYLDGSGGPDAVSEGMIILTFTYLRAMDRSKVRTAHQALYRGRAVEKLKGGCVGKEDIISLDFIKGKHRSWESSGLCSS